MNYINQITEKIIGCAIKVHTILGPGFLESVYHAALAQEMNKIGLTFKREMALPVEYEGIILQEIGFRCDFLVENVVIVEVKAVRQITPIDEAQILNYLKVGKRTVGLIFNFHVMKLKDGGIRRMVNRFSD